MKTRPLFLVLLIGLFCVSGVFGAISDGQVAYYTFNTTAGATVDVANGYTTTASGSPTTALSSVLNGAVNLSNSARYAIPAGFPRLSGNYTVAFWINPYADATDNYVTSDWQGGSLDYIISYDTSTGNKIRVSNGNGASSDQVYSTSTLAKGTWTHVVVTRNGTTIKIYLNGTSNTNFTSSYSGTTGVAPRYIGTDGAGGTTAPFALDEMGFWNRSLNASEAADLFAANVRGWSYPFVGPVLTVGVNNSVNGSMITGFCMNATGTNTTQNTCNLTGTSISFNTTGIYNITVYNVSNNSYFNATITNYNFSSTTSINLSTYQALLSITARQLFTNNSIQIFNVTNNLAANTTIGGSLLVPANNGTNNLKTDVPGNYSMNQTCTATSLTTTSCTINGIYDAIYGFQANNTYNGTLIPSFTINGTNTTLGGTVINQNTTNGSMNISLLRGYSYFFQFSSGNGTYEYTNATLTPSTSYQFYQFNVSPAPSINITIRDASTGALITQNITLVLAGNTTGQTNYTISGGFFYVNVSSGSYSLKLSNANYSQAQYALNATVGQVYRLTAYLQQNTSVVVMQFVDGISSSIVIPDVFCSQLRLVNGTWSTISTKYTDITGRTSFNYLDTLAYRFVCVADGYQTKEFELDPVLFSSYTVKMARSSTLSSAEDYQGIYIDYTPATFYSNHDNNLTLSILSPYGLLNNYTYIFVYPGGSVNGSGTISQGEQKDLTIPIGAAALGDKVNITITYHTNLSGTRTFFAQHLIITNTTNTWVGRADPTYGMGLIERALVGTIIIVIAAGVITLALGSLPGLFLAILIMGVFIKIGFWEWWLAGISFLIAFAIIARRAA